MIDIHIDTEKTPRPLKHITLGFNRTQMAELLGVLSYVHSYGRTPHNAVSRALFEEITGAMTRDGVEVPKWTS